MGSTGSGVAVLDLGTARSKAVLVTGRGDGREVVRLSQDTFFASGTPREALARLGELVGDVRRLGVSNAIVVGSEFFRSLDPASDLAKGIQEMVGQVTVLTREAEARAFYRSLAAPIGPYLNFLATDIGGGSVQLVWGPEDGESRSEPIGTFALEQEFQGEGTTSLTPGSDEHNEMARKVAGAVARLVPAGMERPKLVVGSNLMASFFRSAAPRCGLETDAGEEEGEATGDLAMPAYYPRVMRDDILGVPYDCLASYFPENPRFMYGADKLLIVLAEIVNVVQPATVIATNSSVASGIACLALEGGLDTAIGPTLALRAL